MPAAASPPKPRRRFRVRFSLRLFMVFMLSTCIGFGWLGLRYREARRQRAVIAQIEKMGGSVEFRETSWLPLLDTHMLDRVEEVDLKNTQVSDLTP